MSVAIRIARRNTLRRGPTRIVSMNVCACSMAVSKRSRSFAAAASISSLRTDTSDAAANRTIAAAASRGTALLHRGAARGLCAEEAGGLDELLDGGLIFAACLQQIDADRVSDRNERVRRVGVKLLQSGDEFEAAHFSCRPGLLSSARGERGTWRIRSGGDVDLGERFCVTLRIADGPEQLF